MIEGNYYWLVSSEGEKTLAYYYRNPDALMHPKKPMIEGKDYSALGFGFNTADGGGFLFATDLKETITVIKAEIKPV